MADFVSASQALQYKEGDWLDGIRQAGASAWSNFSLPTRKDEDWRYTSLKSLARRDVFSSQPPRAHVNNLSQIDALSSNRLVFVNGHYDSSLSATKAQEGMTVSRFEIADDEQRKLIEKNLNTVVDVQKHGFAALNSQCLSDGIFVHVGKNVVVDEPIYIVNIITDADVDFSVNSRVLVLAEEDTQAKVVEHFSSALNEKGNEKAKQNFPFLNAVTEVVVQENAAVEHYQILEQNEHCNHIGAIHSVLHRNARFDSFYLSMGTLLTRVDVSLTYAGEGAEANMNGVYLPEGRQHVDFHTAVEHAVPHCQTNEVFRGIVADEARAVFNGRIHIHPDAQKTEAYLSNKNLLASDKAEVNTKPELEIYADDVRCAHGATVSQLEPEALHYLKTRGIGETDGLTMLSFGFINEIIEQIKLSEVGDYCRSVISARFGRCSDSDEVG